MHGVPFPAVTFLCRTMEVSISTTMLFYSIKFFRAKNCTLPPIFSCPVVYASFFRRLKFYKTSTLLHFRQSHLKKKILTCYNLIGDFLKKNVRAGLEECQDPACLPGSGGISRPCSCRQAARSGGELQPACTASSWVCLVPQNFQTFHHIHHISYHIKTLNITNNPCMEY